MIRAVLDTNIVVAGLRSRNGASFAILRMVADRVVRPLSTTALFLEYESVLKRPEQVAAHGFSEAALDGFLGELAALIEAVETHFLWRPQLADPGDEMVLETMINGRGDVLVTHNVGDFLPAARQFGSRVLRPSEFLTEFVR